MHTILVNRNPICTMNKGGPGDDRLAFKKSSSVLFLLERASFPGGHSVKGSWTRKKIESKFKQMVIMVGNNYFPRSEADNVKKKQRFIRYVIISRHRNFRY